MKDKLDILKEVGNTAAAHGGMALSEMLKRKITLTVPSVSVVPTMDLSNTIKIGQNTMVLQSDLLSGITGTLMYVLEEKSAYKLVDTYYRSNALAEEKKDTRTAMAMSLIKEIGNVVIFAYVGTLGHFLNKMIIPSLPMLINAPLNDIIKVITADHDPQESAIVIESAFQEPKAGVEGNFWLVLTPQAAEEIQKECEKSINNIR